MLRELHVMSRRLVRQCYPDHPWALVSITDPPPDGEPLKLYERWGLRRICRLEFHDFDPPRHDASQEYKGRSIIECAMQSPHADELAAFLSDLDDTDVHTLIVHCEAGASRSPSIALAIRSAGMLDGPAKWHRGELGDTTDLPNDPPNRWVYWQVLHAIRRQKEKAGVDGCGR